MALSFLLADLLAAGVLVKTTPTSKPQRLLLPPTPLRKIRLVEKVDTLPLIQKEEPPMTRKQNPAFVDELENNNDHEHEQPHKNETLPLARASRHDLAFPEKKPGFWASLFDPQRRIREHHETERYKIYEETKTDLYRINAAAAKERGKISAAVSVGNHRSKGTQFVKTETLKNEGIALCAQNEDFVELLDRVARLNLDPHLQEQLVTRLFTIYFGNGKHEEDKDNDKNN